MEAKRTMLAALLAGAAMALSGGAQATLEQVAPIDVTGTGLGAVNTVLTIHDNDGTEAGSVGLDSAGNQVTSGDTQAITQVRSFAELGLTQASDLRIIFNPAEPGDVNSPISLDNLVLSLFDPSGTLLFSSGPFTPVVVDAAANPGIGNAGFVFQLDATQAAAAQTAAFTGPNFSSNVLGLAATASQAEGGLETFFAVAIPEPETYAMMLAGLGLLGLMARRRREVKEG